jgi:hypothetical protein
VNDEPNRLGMLERLVADAEREIIALRERCAVLEQRVGAAATLIIENTRITQSTLDSVGSLRVANDAAVASLRTDIADVVTLMQGSRSLFTLAKWLLGAVAVIGGAVSGYLGITRLWR